MTSPEIESEAASEVNAARDAVQAYAQEMATLSLTTPTAGDAGNVPIGTRAVYAGKAFDTLLEVLDEIEELSRPPFGPGIDSDDQAAHEGVMHAILRINNVIKETLS